MKKQVLGVKIDDINMEEAVDTVGSWLSRPGKHYIVTPNPEFLVTAKSDKAFQMILNRADLSIPDGIGLRLGGIKNTVTGVDLMERLIKMAAEKGYTIGLLGGRDEVAELCAERLKKRYPGLKVSYISSGLPHTTNYQLPTTNLLFVALGHPKQEKWIAENLDKIPVKIAIGVGGAFDYISGKVIRAPKWIRNLKLEWLFRLLVQPWRIKRQLALIKYVWFVLKWRYV